MNFGLNIRKKSKPKRMNFEEDDDGSDSNISQNAIVAREISKLEGKESQHIINQQNKALEEDGNIFDYDAVYDGIQKQKLVAKRIKDGYQGEGAPKKARYMENLIANARIKRQERENQKEKRLREEREEYERIHGVSEVYVTESYKQKKEEEARLKETLSKRESNTNNSLGFYQGLLDQVAESRTPMISGDKQFAMSLMEEEKVDRSIDVNVKRNEEGEIVDKTQLLKGGLNISRKKHPIASGMPAAEQVNKPNMLKRYREHLEKSKRDIEFVQQQQKRIESQKIVAAQVKEQEMVKALSTKVTEDKISEARARYLARKKNN